MTSEAYERLRTARIQDEDESVRVLQVLGFADARVNTKIATQKAHGDILVTLYTEPSSIECQVSRTHTKCSYTADKVTYYIGQGKARCAYVLLGCRQSSLDEDMLYIIMRAIDLHALIKENTEEFRPPDGSDKYYVIPPVELCRIRIATGNSIREVLERFINSGDLQTG